MVLSSTSSCLGLSTLGIGKNQHEQYLLYLVQKFTLMRGRVSTDDPQDVAHRVVLCFYAAQYVRFRTSTLKAGTFNWIL